MSENAAPQGLDLAESCEEAERRATRWSSKDPFPEIRPALLNSADIADYVAQTGMIYPFNPGRLKSASYPIRLLGDVLFWDEQGNRVSETLKEGEKFTLPRNSIAFVTLEPVFRFPDYIAGRFNLKIPNVYKGLLLGTGPLVDPGWSGRLSFPLHNLTTNSYDFIGGDEIIWMEFTKLSENDRWLDRSVVSPARHGKYSEFPGEKPAGADVHARVASSAPNTPVSSSLANALTRADDAAVAAQNAERTARRFAVGYSIVGGVAVVVGLATIIALAVQVWQLKVDQRPAPNPTEEARFAKLEDRSAQLERELMRLRASLVEVQSSEQRVGSGGR
jgi:deoxycytidine triphosphate deaminase